MPNPPYRDIDDCRPLIDEYGDQLDSATDDKDSESRNSSSTRRYKQDIRWFDEWLDEQEIDDVRQISRREANQLALTLNSEFNGGTGLQRWNIINRLYNWMQALGEIDENPLAAIDDVKAEEHGLNKTTEQDRQLEDDEFYAPSPEEIRLYEEHAGTQHRTRNQLIIRFLYQTMVRPGEAAQLTVDDIDRENREVEIRDEVAKNESGRIVAYQPSLDGLLEKYLETIRPDRVVGKDHGRVFVGERGGKMSYNAISEVVKKAACRADEEYPERNLQRELYETADGQPRMKVAGHSPRHAGATYAANHTEMGIYELSRALGHSSVETTERKYVEDKKTAPTEHMHKYGPE